MRRLSSPFNSGSPVLLHRRRRCLQNSPNSFTFCSQTAPSAYLPRPPKYPSQQHDLHTSPSKKLPKDLILLLKSCTHKTHLSQIHSHLISNGTCDRTVFLHLLSKVSLPPFNDLDYSEKIFRQYPKRNVPLYTVMIRAHSLSDSSPMIGYELYKEMIYSGFKPDGFCLLSAIKCCMKMGSLFNGLQVHGRIVRVGCNADCFLLCSLMDFYAANGKCQDACKVFDDMSYRDIVAWNSLISCYLQSRRSRDVLTVFEIMGKSERRQPDEVTCLFALEACANLNALEFGKRVHDYVSESGMDGSMQVCNALIKMYSRCACIEKAYNVFSGMVKRDVVTWSSMISGLASNGYARDAIDAFRRMQREGIAPDEQTFTAVLSGCSHSGLVDDGRMIFNCMKEEFGLVPNIYHYGCMVDMLSRAGLLDKAYNLISEMEVKPDAAIWRTLLGACKIHKHFILGEQIVEHLIELKAEEAGDYVLLLNIYSAVGNWEKVKEIRLLMWEKGIQTAPACCTIEVNGTVHEFATDDIFHPRRGDIYKQLDEINDQLRIAGYVAEITPKSMDVESEPTKLSYHSEKLAIAFGVLATPPGTKLRIAKDLRICGDCHNFAKTFSSVYNREVIIRDRNRFHHFRECRCSCNDYW